MQHVFCYVRAVPGANHEAFQTRHNLVIVGHLLMADLFQHSVAWEGKQ